MYGTSNHTDPSLGLPYSSEVTSTSNLARTRNSSKRDLVVSLVVSLVALALITGYAGYFPAHESSTHERIMDNLASHEVAHSESIDEVASRKHHSRSSSRRSRRGTHGRTHGRTHDHHEVSSEATSSGAYIYNNTRDSPVSEGVSYPSIFFMLIDDQGYGDMGYSNTFDQLADATPTLDTMAANGIKLMNYYSQHLCTPARAALLTGHYPIHLGMQHSVIQPESLFGLPAKFKLLPAYLKEGFDYHTYMIGKWHLGHYKAEYLPWNRGFDHVFGYLTDQLWYYSHKSCHSCAEKDGGVTCVFDMSHNGVKAEAAVDVYSTFLFRDVVGDILEVAQYDSKPSFFYVSWQAVHAPLDDVPKGYFSKGQLELLDAIVDPYRRTFAAMSITLDTATKNIVDMTRKYGMYDNSIFIVASDNGGCSYSGGYNYPLRGGKTYLYEGGIRVNAFVFSELLPDAVRGSEYGVLFHVTDWLPTIVTGFLGGDSDLLPDTMDGVDHYQAMVNGEEYIPRNMILHNIDIWNDDGFRLFRRDTQMSAIRVGDMKLIMGQDDSDWYFPAEKTCNGNATYCSPGYEAIDDCLTYGYNATYLFNISNDPYETLDIAADFPDIVTELLDLLAKYERGMEWPVWATCDYDNAYATWLDNKVYVGPFRDSGSIFNKTGNPEVMDGSNPSDDNEMTSGSGQTYDYDDENGNRTASASTRTSEKKSEIWHKVQAMFEEKWLQPKKKVLTASGTRVLNSKPPPKIIHRSVFS